MPTRPSSKYFFYAGNFIDGASITGIFDELPEEAVYAIGVRHETRP